MHVIRTMLHISSDNRGLKIGRQSHLASMAVIRLLTGDAATDGPVSMGVVPNDIPLRDRFLAGRPCDTMSIGALLSSAMFGKPAPGRLRDCIASRVYSQSACLQ